MHFFAIFSCFIFVFSFFIQASAQAKDFQSWLNRFAAQALRHGVSPATLRAVIPKLEIDKRVIALDQKQPEGTATFDTYYNNVVTPWRIQEGRRLAIEHKILLAKLAQEYGVKPSVILALWAIESGYGTNIGKFDVLTSLATLAYEGRRAVFFRNELIEALKILDEEKLPPFSLKGSWAGAMGQCQFMPSTYRKYALDGNGDTVRDIWNENADVLTSIAHYLAAEGWQADKGWGIEVEHKKFVPIDQKGFDVQHNFQEWSKRGVVPLHEDSFPKELQEKEASLVHFLGTGGRSFLVYDNFHVLLKWNHSSYFATAVGLLSQTLDERK